MRCCGPSQVVDGVAASSSSGRASIVRYEVDFADATPGSLQPDGAYVLVDRQWTSVNSVTGATSLAIGANGLEFVANTATTQTSTAGITAAGILIDLGVLVGSAYDPTLRYRVEALIAANNGDANSERVVVGLQKPANDPTGTSIAFVGANSGFQTAAGAGMSQNTSVPVLMTDFAFANGFNVITIENTPGVPSSAVSRAGVGTVGAWPADATLRECGWSSQTATVAALTAPRYADASLQVGIYFPTGNASGTFAAAVRALRVQEIAG